MISGALYHLVTTCPVSSRFMFFLWSLVFTSRLRRSSFFCSLYWLDSPSNWRLPSDWELARLAWERFTDIWASSCPICGGSRPRPLTSSCCSIGSGDMSLVEELVVIFSSYSYFSMSFKIISEEFSTPFTLLARPKSHSLTEQSSFIRILAGLRSRCITLDSCKYLRAHNKL